jgi:hypothetical protein
MVHLRPGRLYTLVDHGRFFSFVIWSNVHCFPGPEIRYGQEGFNVRMICGPAHYVAFGPWFQEEHAAAESRRHIIAVFPISPADPHWHSPEKHRPNLYGQADQLGMGSLVMQLRR